MLEKHTTGEATGRCAIVVTNHFQLEAELEKKQQKIDQLHNHIAELAVLYEVSSSTVEEQEMTIDTMNSSNANVNRVIKSFLKEREECYARVSTELQQAKEEIHALRFTNELLIQKVSFLPS